ncbi:MAG: DNRLRE domain-containing protein [Candidatus Aminicenantes bacterium]|nr:DNRLRE domain-containing protein [Candidatus Aminicenantes bacterium]
MKNLTPRFLALCFVFISFVPQVLDAEDVPQQIVINPKVATYVRSATPNTSLGPKNYVWVGTGCDDWQPDCMATTRGLIRFSLDKIPSQAKITKAVLRAKMSEGRGAGSPNNGYKAGSVRSAWKATTVTWATKPDYGLTYDTVFITESSGTVTWDVTKLVQEWFKGSANNGLYLMKEPEGGSPDHERKFTNLRLAIDFEAPPAFPLLIIAPASYKTALKPLVNHKMSTGLPAKVLTLEAVSNGYQGLDMPEKIKRAIADHQDRHQTKYVMLVGDSDVFPVLYTYKCENEPSSYLNSYRSGDLYYADLYESDGKTLETWDGNRDRRFGEQGCDMARANVDSLDLRPDVAVGRVPVSSELELSVYINKVIRYETQAAHAGWTKRALFITGNYSNSKSYADQIAAALSGSEIVKLYHDDPGCESRRLPTPSNINAQLNRGALFAVYIGHGSQMNWGSGSEGGSCPAVGSAGYDYYAVPNDLAGLQNAGKLPVILTFGCETGQYAPIPPWKFPYLDLDNTRRDYSSYTGTPRIKPERPAPIQTGYDVESMAEHFLLRSGDNGAIAFAGPVVLDVTGESWKIGREVLKAYHNGKVILGDAWRAGYRAFVDHTDTLTNVGRGLNDAWLFKNVEEFHLFGDPSLRLGGI